MLIIEDDKYGDDYDFIDDDNEDGYRVTDAWNGVVWFVDHPVKLLTTENMKIWKYFISYELLKLWISLLKRFCKHDNEDNEKDDKLELNPDLQRWTIMNIG